MGQWDFQKKNLDQIKLKIIFIYLWFGPVEKITKKLYETRRV